MCDTLVKIQGGNLIFGKNSDRSPNEPNLTLFFPARTPENGKIDCTYIPVEWSKPGHPVLLVAPSWMWGAEMGINDNGVIIGNEAVFTRSKDKKTERLTGMDLLRLALENSGNAQEAKDLILDLLDQYGQGGNCGFDKPFYYDNSFLIADRREAFILETSGKEWIVRPVAGQGNISNRLSIQDSAMVSNPPKSGFARDHTEPVFTFFSGSLQRQTCAGEALRSEEPFDVSSMMEILRSHREKDSRNLYSKGSVKSVCMHKSFLGDHTTGSMIVQTRDTFDTIWLTGCSTPCLSLYKPVYFGEIVPPVFTAPQASFEYWLEREYLVRAIFAGLVDSRKYREELNVLQDEFVRGDQKLASGHPTSEERREFSRTCSHAEQEFVNRYQNAITLVREGKVEMPPLWEKQTSRLGKNVFCRTLSERKRK